MEFWGRKLERQSNSTKKVSFLISKVERILPPGSLLDAQLTTERGRKFISSFLLKKKGERRVKSLIYVLDIGFYKGEFVGRKTHKKEKKF